jgi:hypothetical protein
MLAMHWGMLNHLPRLLKDNAPLSTIANRCILVIAIITKLITFHHRPSQFSALVSALLGVAADLALSADLVAVAAQHYLAP